MIKKRTTIYLEDNLTKILKIRAIKANQSVSDYISQILKQDLLEEQNDLADIQKILKEHAIAFEEMLKILKIEKDV